MLGVLRDAYCRTIGVEYMHIQEPEEKRWIQEQVEGVTASTLPPRSSATSSSGSTPPRRSRSSSPPSTWGRSASASRAPSRRSRSSTILSTRRRRRARRRRDRHGPPRPPQRAVQHRGQELRGRSSREFEGHVDPDSVQGSGDVKYHLGATGKYESPLRRRHQGRARRQPEPPRGRRPGRRWAWPAPSRTRSTPRGRRSRCCRCSSTATPRSPARASSPRPST
jgi:multifunctional 2-oxoglutarate metabolism enzyme